MKNTFKAIAIQSAIMGVLCATVGGILGRLTPSLVADFVGRPYAYGSQVMYGICAGAVLGLGCGALAGSIAALFSWFRRSKVGGGILRVTLISIVVGVVAASASWANMAFYAKAVSPSGEGFVNFSGSHCRGWPLPWYFGSTRWYGWEGFRAVPFVTDAGIFALVAAILLGICVAYRMRVRPTNHTKSPESAGSGA